MATATMKARAHPGTRRATAVAPEPASSEPASSEPVSLASAVTAAGTHHLTSSAGFLSRRPERPPEMKTTFPTESHTSAAPGIIPEPAVIHAEAVPPPPRRRPLARVLAALRGDKYMVDAYPPAGPPTKEQ